jgi:hypothetical protein
MARKTAILILLLFIIAFPFLSGCEMQKADLTVEQWRVAEISLASSKSYANPFMDVDVTAIFTGPGGESIQRPAFWDGGNTWKIRFAPTRTGLWTYRTSSTDTQNDGLNKRSGTIRSVAYKGSLPIYQHGFVKVSQNGRYLTYADGAPFFFLGDTHWLMPHEKWDACNKPGCESEFKFMVDRRVTQKFTVYQSEPQGLDGQAWNAGVTEVYPEKFTDLDRKFQYIAEGGLVHATALGCHSQALDLTGPGAARLARYWVARYGAYPVLWFTAQEFDINYPQYEEIWKQAAEAISATDGYHHPITGHYYSTALGQNATYWGDQPWHSYFMLQNGHGRQARPVFYQFYWEFSPAKPFLESEANYEQILNGAVNSHMVRVSAYTAIQSGSLGFGYGANGIWNDIYAEGDEGCCVKDYGFTPWQEAIDFEGGDQMTYLYNFYTALDWWKLEPRFRDPSWAKLANPEQIILKSDGNQVYVVHFGNITTKTGLLKNMQPGASYTAKWFDPRKGEYTEISTSVQPSSNGEWEMPPKPDEQDWVLLMVKR